MPAKTPNTPAPPIAGCTATLDPTCQRPLARLTPPTPRAVALHAHGARRGLPKETESQEYTLWTATQGEQ